MKVALVSETDISGGAARATYRVHRALIQSHVDSIMIVNHAISQDETVSGPSTAFQKLLVRLRLLIGNKISSFQKSANPILHSAAWLPSIWLRKLNRAPVDIINLHWINGEMISIEDIPKIKTPLVWTLHDMWAFCGAEHYAFDNRYKEGYYAKNRPDYEIGFALNQWVWKRKCRAWKKPIQIVTPSHHMADCIRKSVIMQDWPVTVIPNTLDLDIWKPVNKAYAKSIMGLPEDKPIITFGALGIDQHHKGFDLLKNALKNLANQIPNLQLVIFGAQAPKDQHDFGFPVHYTGLLSDDLSLRVMYSAADVMVVPSRFESFGQTASEAQACGTPVVAFNATGLKDIVIHKHSGYLAEPFDPSDLAEGIKWVLENARDRHLSENARQNASEKFSYEVVSKQYIDVYKAVLSLK
jgi:glycosyltransferase involved in cell wall biosynthesis